MFRLSKESAHSRNPTLPRWVRGHWSEKDRVSVPEVLISQMVTKMGTWELGSQSRPAGGFLPSPSSPFPPLPSPSCLGIELAGQPTQPSDLCRSQGWRGPSARQSPTSTRLILGIRVKCTPYVFKLWLLWVSREQKWWVSWIKTFI